MASKISFEEYVRRIMQEAFYHKHGDIRILLGQDPKSFWTQNIACNDIEGTCRITSFLVDLGLIDLFIENTNPFFSITPLGTAYAA